MASGIFNVGVSGLNAAMMGLQTTSHNISNASTDGYTRQQTVQTTNTPMVTGAGFIGQGTNVETVKRIYSQYLSGQVLSAQTSSSAMDSYLSQIQQIDNLLADSSAGLSPALTSFFKGVQEATANPSSIASRQSMLSSTQTLVSQFNAIDSRLSEIRNGINTQVGNEVTTINAYAAKIAELNQNIINAQATSNGQPPNDLLDQRDQLVSQLNKEVRVQTVNQSDGTYSIFIGNGQPLVVGTSVTQLQALASTNDPSRITVATTAGANSKPIYIPESLLAGGTLGGLISFRNESLDPVQNGIGRIALTLAQNVNDQHALGMDLDGKLGGKFFDMSQMVSSPMADTNNTGNASLSMQITNTGLLSTSDYRLSYNGSTYALTRLSDNTITDLGSGPTLNAPDGFSLTVASGTPALKDSWLIQPTRNGAKNMAMSLTDPRSIALAAPIKTSSALTNTGTGSIDAGTMVSTTTPATAAAAFATTGQLTPPILIKFTSSTTYDVYDSGSPPPSGTPLASGVPYTSGSDIFPISAAATTGAGLDYGYRIKISGSPAANDTFNVAYNANGVSDNRNGVLLGALQTSTKMESTATSPNTGTASYSTAYAQLVSYVGSKTNEITVTGQAQQTLSDQATTAVQQLSGVNLDEEAANLLRYQQAYQAASKMISVASKLFDSILAIG